MNPHLLSPEDLVHITGAKRYSKQRRWFKEQFGIDVTSRDNGSIVMAWATFEGLLLKKCGLPVGNSPAPRREVKLCFD
ncbi:uncharacterized protein DUF4224 [Paraburkholderia sp. BL6665CI2N2]|uniref:DUF4224 domain-containing protein n=1 Tax=Paraburkholderia sp. BL6665CI2N2 TaxID=1938806 RepID=UPI001066AF0B|nr:DUF4224 domain-containing protein [Paraburkholderia sp. BL6665CI2N2]TDY25750.1 uncharacterized protein DUF4224 [Paraburkholderia sp. BL6665CI2N2]